MMYTCRTFVLDHPLFLWRFDGILGQIARHHHKFVPYPDSIVQLVWEIFWAAAIARFQQLVVLHCFALYYQLLFCCVFGALPANVEIRATSHHGCVAFVLLTGSHSQVDGHGQFGCVTMTTVAIIKVGPWTHTYPKHPRQQSQRSYICVPYFTEYKWLDPSGKSEVSEDHHNQVMKSGNFISGNILRVFPIRIDQK